MRNLYPPTVPLTPDHLAAQEAAREDSLALLLDAVTAQPGVVRGAEVTLDGDAAVVAPGLVVWPDEAGRLRLVEIREAQRLRLDEAEGVVALWPGAEVYTAPVTALGPDSLPVSAPTRAERWAYAAGAGRADLTVQTPGLAFVPASASVAAPWLPLAEVAGGVVRPCAPSYTTRAAPAAAPQVVNLGGVVDALRDELTETLAPPTAEEVTQAVLAALPEPEPLPEPASGPTADEVAASLLGLLPAAIPEPRAYYLNHVRALDSATPTPQQRVYTLPELPEGPYILTFSGRGDIAAQDGVTVTMQPEVTDIPEMIQQLAMTDPGLLVGDVVGLNGPDAGFYVSTMLPVRDEMGNHALTEAGMRRWRMVLQVFTPGNAVPIIVKTSEAVDVPEGTSPLPYQLSGLAGTLTWGPHALGIAVDSRSNSLSAVVNGRRLLYARADGLAPAQLRVAVQGVLLVQPLAAAPENLDTEALNV